VHTASVKRIGLAKGIEPRLIPSSKTVSELKALMSVQIVLDNRRTSRPVESGISGYRAIANFFRAAASQIWQKYFGVHYAKKNLFRPARWSAKNDKNPGFLKTNYWLAEAGKASLNEIIIYNVNSW